jgi:hypothetical protein
MTTAQPPRASDAPRHASMEARLADHVWSIEELLNLLDRHANLGGLRDV